MQPAMPSPLLFPACASNQRSEYIHVKDFDESMRFYTQTMGFRERPSLFKNAEGKPALAYLQITRDTFLELAPATADRPVGLSHIGIWPKTWPGRRRLRSHGVMVAGPAHRLDQNQHHQCHRSQRRPAGTGRFSGRLAAQESHGRIQIVLAPS